MKSLSIEIQPTGTASAKNGEIAEGLQKEGNRIALGVGLGVGIPALIVAVIALYLQIMKRRTRP
jgi:hypothetical protein